MASEEKEYSSVLRVANSNFCRVPLGNVSEEGLTLLLFLL